MSYSFVGAMIHGNENRREDSMEHNPILKILDEQVEVFNEGTGKAKNLKANVENQSTSDYGRYYVYVVSVGRIPPALLGSKEGLSISHKEGTAHFPATITIRRSGQEITEEVVAASLADKVKEVLDGFVWDDA